MSAFAATLRRRLFNDHRTKPHYIEGREAYRLIQAANTARGNFSTAKSLVLNSTVIPTGSLLYLSLWGRCGDARPNASVLNALDGVVTSNMAVVPTTNGSVNAFASGSTHFILDLSGYFAP